MEAARYTDRWPTSAIIFRKTYQDLSQPGGLLERSHQWWKGKGPHWDGVSRTWRFPSGATVKFGYLDNEQDHLNYQGGEYQIVCFDELTQMREFHYLYMFTRLRDLKGSPIVPRMRGATNPGGPGHEWVKKRFNLPYGPVGEAAKTRRFVLSLMDDNPYLDTEDYEKKLAMLSETGFMDASFQQLRHGDWDAAGQGGYFDTTKVEKVPWSQIPHAADFARVIRYWDFGTTEPTETNPDPDWTVGMKIAETRHSRTFSVLSTRGEVIPGLPDHQREKRYVKIQLTDLYILDVKRFRGSPSVIEEQVRTTARQDGLYVPVWIEEERGAAGKNFVHSFRTHVIPHFRVRGFPVWGDKKSRGRIGSTAVNIGRVHVPADADWWPDLKIEMDVFDGLGKTHDDQIDTLGYGIQALAKEAMMHDDGPSVVMRDMRDAGQATRDPHYRGALGYVGV